MASDIVLGFRPHTYWTAIAAVTASLEAPEILFRERIVFATGAERGVYHQAAEAAAATAQDLIEGVRSAVRANARTGITQTLNRLRNNGSTIRVAAVPTGGRRIPSQPAEIIRSHTMQHAAEGEFYRDIVAGACSDLGLTVRRPVESELMALVSDRLGLDRTELQSKLRLMGAALGPPWSEDQRLAVLAAWLEL